MTPEQRQAILAKAFVDADRAMATFSIPPSPALRRYNQLSWAVLDLQDAGAFPSEWQPLQAEARAREREGLA